MSATHPVAVEHEPVEDVTPVRIAATSLESTAPEYLLECKHELAEAGLAPAVLVVDACFDEACSLSTQEEVDRVREHVRVASFLGAGQLTVRVDEVADEAAAVPALEASAERAEREGVSLVVEGPVALDA